jgi:hypothetical protein
MRERKTGTFRTFFGLFRIDAARRRAFLGRYAGGQGRLDRIN